MTQRPDDIFGTSDDGRDDDSPLGRGDRDRRPRVSDFVRRAIENTVGSVQNTGSAPREALEYLLKQGDRGRRELFRIVAHEVNDFLKHVDVAGEVVKVLTSVEVEFKANLRFKPSESALRVEPTPESSVSVNLASVGGEEEPPRDPRDPAGARDVRDRDPRDPRDPAREARDRGPDRAAPRPDRGSVPPPRRATGEHDTEDPTR